MNEPIRDGASGKSNAQGLCQFRVSPCFTTSFEAVPVKYLAIMSDGGGQRGEGRPQAGRQAAKEGPASRRRTLVCVSDPISAS